MASHTPDDEKALGASHNSPGNMVGKVDTEILRNTNNLGVDALPDPDQGASEEERARIVSSSGWKREFLISNITLSG